MLVVLWTRDEQRSYCSWKLIYRPPGAPRPRPGGAEQGDTGKPYSMRGMEGICKSWHYFFFLAWNFLTTCNARSTTTCLLWMGERVMSMRISRWHWPHVCHRDCQPLNSCWLSSSHELARLFLLKSNDSLVASVGVRLCLSIYFWNSIKISKFVRHKCVANFLSFSWP